MPQPAGKVGRRWQRELIHSKERLKNNFGVSGGARLRSSRAVWLSCGSAGASPSPRGDPITEVISESLLRFPYPAIGNPNRQRRGQPGATLKLRFRQRQQTFGSDSSTAGATLCQPRASKSESHEHLCCPGGVGRCRPSAASQRYRASGRRPRPKPAAACFGLGHVALGHRIARSTDGAGPLDPGALTTPATLTSSRPAAGPCAAIALHYTGYGWSAREPATRAVATGHRPFLT